MPNIQIKEKIKKFDTIIIGDLCRGELFKFHHTGSLQILCGDNNKWYSCNIATGELSECSLKTIITPVKSTFTLVEE
jgi:hypothetical protein